MPDINVINKESEQALAISQTAVRFEDIAKTMGQAYEKLWTYIIQQGKEVVGMPYCKYSNATENFMQFDIEMGMPVAQSLPEHDEMYMSQTCAGKAISAIHKGAYKDLEKTYTRMMAYLAQNNLQATGIYYDYYLNDPATTPKDELLTRVVYLIQ